VRGIRFLRRTALVALTLALACSPTRADPTTYRIDPAHTRAEFTIEHLGVLHAQGRFAKVSGRLVFDPAARDGSIELDIASNSVVTGWDVRDEFIKGSTLFDSAQYPRVHFRSTRFEFANDKLVRVDGDLTLRDVTRPVSLDVRSLECGHPANGCTAEAAGAIRRREFAMDAWWPLIGDEVYLRFRLFAVKE
jgi:polyisoprenoid-binding protein YceI